ncbi:GPI-anchored wall transfer protein 1 [Rhizoctonia solani AG-1 IA]|uniref:GPI-anchored wall transfer protein 1 n=1 Tax=Thanatephorus cucumeris (strain AG1-IA) TaxID=983506 RepID=L8WK88_THACA|nr:GPI-anchored wall transfer protein 1 [Rhizoctonia solani AG-1 IA]
MDGLIKQSDVTRKILDYVNILHYLTSKILGCCARGIGWLQLEQRGFVPRGVALYLIMTAYKQEKEDFVSGNNGSTVYHINAISTVALASVALYFTLQSRVAFPSRLSAGSGSRLMELSAEYLLLIVPLVLSLTLFANHPLSLTFLLLFPAFAIHRALPPLPPPAQGSLLPPPSPSLTRSPSPSPTPTRTEHSSIYVIPTPNLTPTPRQSAFPKAPPSNTIHVPPLPALTTYRAHMMLMTVIAILAVDFPVFPRALSKCESWGVSVMDLGVGSFVFSQGVVSAVPVIKNPGLLKNPVLPKVLAASKKVIPLLVLGLLRVLAVKGTEYPEHVTEYGVHWNFFITLALLPPLSVMFHPLIVYAPLSLLGLVLTLVVPIIIKLGYLSIHLLGMAIGTLILPPSPTHFRRAVSDIASKDNSAAPSRTPSRAPSPIRPQVDRDLHMGRRPATPDSSDDDEPRKKPTLTLHYTTEDQPRKRGKAAVELCSYAIVWWTLFYLAGALSGSGAQGVSRRLANTMYVLWVTAFNTTFLVGYVLLEGIWGGSPRSQPAASDRLRGSSPKGFAPSFKLPGGSDSIRNGPNDSGTSGLLEAVNLNGLANIATGLVNMTIRTMYVPDGQAMLVLFGYTFAFSLCAWAFRGRRILSMI